MKDQALFDKIDLHLIRVLNTVLTERSVSRAAIRLGMYQPAVSAALKRLRGLAGDPILVRSGAGAVAAVYYNVNGAWAQIGSTPALANTTGTIRLEVIGNSVKLFVNNVLKVFGPVSGLSSPGSAGLVGSANAALDKSAAAAAANAIRSPESKVDMRCSPP